MLLAEHYPPGEFQVVPSKVCGDAGVDGLVKGGIIYQCYATEEPVATAERTKNQKKKLRSEVAKFIKNGAKLKRLLGNAKICNWIFVFPQFADRELVACARELEAIIRTSDLDFVSDDFWICIEDGRKYIPAYMRLVDSGYARIRLEVPLTSPDDVDELALRTSFVSSLEKKMKSIVGSEGNPDDLVRSWLQHYLTGNNVLSELHGRFPEEYAKILRLKREHEEFLALQSALRYDCLPGAVVREQLTEYEKRLAEAVPGLDEYHIRQLVYEAVADWLIRCPLSI